MTYRYVLTIFKESMESLLDCSYLIPPYNGRDPHILQKCVDMMNRRLEIEGNNNILISQIHQSTNDDAKIINNVMETEQYHTYSISIIEDGISKEVNVQIVYKGI